MAVNEQLKIVIERIKIDRGMTQKEIASLLNVNNTYLSGVINGKQPYSEALKSKIRELVQVSKRKEYEIYEEKSIQVSEDHSIYVDDGIPLIPYSCLNKTIDITNSSFKRYSLPFFTAGDFLIQVSGAVDNVISPGDVITCKLLKDNEYWFQNKRVYFLSTTQGPLLGYIEFDEKDIFLTVASNSHKQKIPLHSIFNIAIVLGVSHSF